MLCGCFDSQNNRKPIKLCFVVVVPWALFLLIDNYSAKSKPERVLPNRSLRARLDWRKNIGKVKESSSYSIIHCSSVWNKGMSWILFGGTVSKPVLLEESKNPLRPKGNHSCRARVRVHKLIKLTSHGVLQFFLITALKFSETNTPKHRLQYKREKWKEKRTINGNEPRITTQIFLIYDWKFELQVDVKLNKNQHSSRECMNKLGSFLDYAVRRRRSRTAW